MNKDLPTANETRLVSLAESQPIEAAVHAIRGLQLKVVKTGEVKGKFKFPSFVDVWALLQPHLADFKLSVGFGNTSIRFDAGLEIMRLELIVGNGTEKVREAYEILLPETIRNQSGNAVTNGSQRSGGAASYAKRTALILFFNIAAGDEDEVERMTPSASQSNIPGLIMVRPDTRWQDLTDGDWRDAMSPFEDGKTCDHAEKGEEHMRELWRQYPTHPALMAYWADWVLNKMQESGMTWKDLREKNKDLPEHIHNCTCRKDLAPACLIFQPKPSQP